MHKPQTAIPFILLVVLLAGCKPGASAVKMIQQQAVEATQAALYVLTEIARASITPTPSPVPPATETPLPPSQTPTHTASEMAAASPTPAPGALRVTAQPGLTLYTHPDIPDYVFQIDPTAWQKDPGGQTANLVHQSIANCQIESVPGQGLAAPQRYFWQDLGRFRWEVMDYGNWAYVVPVLGNGLNQGSSFLRLVGYNQRSCRNAQEDVLANLMLKREAEGQFAFVPFPSPTFRPSPDGFDCPNTPAARLRVGDYVSVITDGLWMRSDPRADNSTRVRKFLRFAPFAIHVIGGPVCDKYVYWQVEVSEFGEGGKTTQGWLAEGDLEEYYLKPVK
jgi:hypothetical protein